jgi:hypothetical protein
MERAAQLDRFLAENVKGISIDAQAVLAHVIRPPNFDDVSPEGPQPNQPLPPGLPPPEIPYHLDVSAFEDALDNALKDVVAGYVAQLRQSGQILFTKARQFAIRHFPKEDGGGRWTADVQMHVASVSKLMTAMAMMVLLRDLNISFDAPIIDYLPDYWVKGSNIDRITFRDLTSGLTANAVVDFNVMKSAIAGGIIVPIRGRLDSDIDILGEYNYQNLNYGLCRILLAVINGTINKDLTYVDTSFNDQIWDTVTIAAYEFYLRTEVFEPSNVGGATLDHPPGCALAYRGPDDREPGWNSGSMQESCGCDGWHLSVNELLNAMGQFPPGQRHSGTGRRAGHARQRLRRGPAWWRHRTSCCPDDARRECVLQAGRLAQYWHQPGRTKRRVPLAARYGAGGVC